MTTRSRVAMLVHSGSRGLRVCVVGVLLCGTAAFAQDVPREPRSAPPHRVGPFTLAPEITLRDIGIDSNVYNSVTNPVSDVTFTVGPAINVTARVKRAIVNLQSTTDLVYFVQQASERSVNQAVSAAAQYPLRRITFGASASYLNTRERPDEEIDARSRRIERGAQATVAVTVWPKLSVEMLGRSSQTDFDADAVFQGILLGDRLDRTTDTLGAGLRYRLTPLTSLVATTESSATTFERAPERNSDARRMMFGVELHPRALISGSATLGHESFDPRGNLIPPFAGVVGSGSVLFRLSRTTGIGFAYDRNLYYSYSEDAPYYMRVGFDLMLRRAVASRWDLEVSAGRYHHTYRYLTTLDPSASANQTILNSSVSAVYQARPGTRFVVGVSYQQRDATAALHGYHSIRLGTSIVYGF